VRQRSAECTAGSSVNQSQKPNYFAAALSASILSVFSHGNCERPKCP
jgi:hypothetical protein